MTETLISYLLQHKSLSIPGLGSMYIERIPAQTDFVNKRILPPDYHFRFDKYFDAPDKDFFTYLAQQKDIADYEAIKWYNEWAYELRNRLRDGQLVKWVGIGTLKKDTSGEIVFEAAGAIPTLHEPAPANRVIHVHAQHTMLVGDREVTREITPVETVEYPPVTETYVEKESWWIYALIIAAIALSVIFFHFYKNGFTTAGTGNRQTIGTPR
jgi:hypothetical protein